MKKFITLAILAVLSINIKAQTFSWSGLEYIYDLQTDTINISVSGLPSVIDTSFGIAHICMNITHTYKGDLLIKLMSPNGNIVTLIQNQGGSADNYTGTCVGMDGTAFSNGTAPYTGLFLASGDVSSFNNRQNPNGIWKFIVSDQANQDTGSIHNVSLAFTNNPPRSASSGGSGSGPTGTYVWPSAVCPGGAAGCDLLPDMTASAKEIMNNHNETPGFLYISNATPNIGYGPIEIYGLDSCFCGTTYVPCGTVCPNGQEIKHIVKQRIYQKVPGNDTLTFYDRIAGAMTYHSTHGHLHVDNWAYYTLRTATSNPDARTWPIVGTGTKQSFCLINLGTCSGNAGECKDNNGNTLTTVPNQNLGFHTGCGLTQGIYPGNYDVYSISLNDPIPLNNVCNGDYFIVSITDPNNDFLESDETNNWVAVPITLTQQSAAPTITAGGPTTFCSGGSVTLTSNIANNYLWSTGATTQSIVVTTSGSYTVSTTCGSSSATSSPVVVNATQLNVVASANPAAPVCNGGVVHLSTTAPAAGTQNIPLVFTNNNQYFIPDNNTTGVTSPITISGINPVTLSATSIVSIKLTLTHTYDGDLAISLISPGGSSIYLSNRRGSGGDNFTNTIFTMSATTLISAGAAPFTGSYKPDGSFSSLIGNANGTWSLKVADLASVDTGRIRSWSITINNTVQESFNFSWASVPSGFSSSLQNPDINPASSANYFVTVTSNASGCNGTSSVAVNVSPVLSITGFTPSSGTPGSVINITGSGFSGASAVTVAGISASGFTVVNSNLIQAVVPNSGIVSGVICVTNSSNCTVCSGNNYSITNSLSLNIRIFIEGFYRGGGLMQASVSPVSYPSICDTIIAELHSQNSPYNLLFSSKSTININGNGTFIFPPAVIGNNYYLVMRHRNAIETWSSSPLLLSDNMLYDFSNSRSKAYGSNLLDLGDGNFAMYSGDITDAATSTLGIQDGIIETHDFLLMNNALALMLRGYIFQDLTGDGIVETADYALIGNKYSYLITAQRP